MVTDPCTSAEAPSLADNATAAYLRSVPLSVAVPPLPTAMPAQSRATGLVASPSPLVSPPMESSRSEVKTTGDVLVPLLVRVPLTASCPFRLLITWPAAMVMVAVGAMVSWLVQ